MEQERAAIGHVAVTLVANGLIELTGRDLYQGSYVHLGTFAVTVVTLTSLNILDPNYMECDTKRLGQLEFAALRSPSSDEPLYCPTMRSSIIADRSTLCLCLDFAGTAHDRYLLIFGDEITGRRSVSALASGHFEKWVLSRALHADICYYATSMVHIWRDNA